MTSVRGTAAFLFSGLLLFAISDATAQQAAQSTNRSKTAGAPSAPIAAPPGPESFESGIPGGQDQSKKSGEETKTPQTAAKEQREEEHKPADPDTGQSTLSDQTLGLLPNPYEKVGIKFSLSYVGEALGNVAGGMRRGAVYDGRLNAAVDLDFGKLAGRPGLTFHANLFEIHGDGLSRCCIGNLITVSSIEALSTLRLYEMWLEQKFSNDKFSLRAGQLAADTEFITSRYTDVFINATYGWPTITAINLPSGGPSPPLAAVGARFKAVLSDNVTLLSAVFNGDPAGPGPDDPQSRNRYGLNFRVNDPPLFINEIQYAYNQHEGSGGLPGTVKLGGWYHAGDFADQRFASNGVSLAAPDASSPLTHRSDFGVYAVFEQQFLSFPGGDGTRGLGGFARVSGSPGDRNLIGFYADGGFNLSGAFAARPDDKIGVGFAYARLSDSARALDRDFQLLANSTRPVRDAETLVSLGYLAQIKQGWNVYPTLQYIIHPGGGYVLDAGAPRAVHNATVLGVRTVLKF